MLLLPQAAKRLLHPHQPKLKDDRVSLIEQSTTGTSVSLVAPYICGYIDPYFLGLISTLLLDAFTTSSGKNLDTDSNQSQNIRGMMILYG